jgi:hypothetical protein
MTVANFSGGDFAAISEYFASANRAVVQLGRTLEWGSRGRGFKSRQPEMMRMIPQNKRNFLFIATLATLGVTGQLVHAEERGSVRLNAVGFEHARDLIRQGHFVDDRKGAWAAHKPLPATENEFIRAHGFAEYAKWHLAIDTRHWEETKARYKFPFGDFSALHRCGLLAAKARAHEYGYAEIESGAAQLLAMIESARPTRQKGID